MTPFYSFDQVLTKIQEYVADINANVEKLPSGSRGISLQS